MCGCATKGYPKVIAKDCRTSLGPARRRRSRPEVLRGITAADLSATDGKPNHCTGDGELGAVHAASALRAGSLAPPSQAAKWPAPSTSIMILGSRAAA